MVSETADRIVFRLEADTTKFTRPIRTAADEAESQHKRLRSAAEKLDKINLMKGNAGGAKEKIFVTYSNATAFNPWKSMFGTELILGRHKAINYIDKSGRRFVAEGVPEIKTEDSLKKGLMFLQEELFSTGWSNWDSPFGRIKSQFAEIPPELVGVRPKFKGDKGDPYADWPQESLIEGDDLSEVFDEIRQTFERRASEGYEYRPLSNNSNTIVDQVLRDLRLPPSLGIDDRGNRYFVPGSNKPLEYPGAPPPGQDQERWRLEALRQEALIAARSSNNTLASIARLDLENIEAALDRLSGIHGASAGKTVSSEQQEESAGNSVSGEASSPGRSAGFLPSGIFGNWPPFGLSTGLVPIGTNSAFAASILSAEAPTADVKTGETTPPSSARLERYAALLQAAQPLIAAYRAELEALTAQEATRDAQLKAGTITQAEHTKAQEKAKEQAKAREKEVAGAITAVGDVFTNGIKGAKDFNDALDSIGLGLLDLAAKGLFGQGALGGVFNQLLGVETGGSGLLSLLGGSSDGSSGGGLWSGIGSLFGNLFGSIFGRAAGGQALPGRLYEVGEAGREWFAPSVPGQVIPNHVIKAAAGGGGGSGQPITFNISMAGANGDRTIAEIAAAAVKKGLSQVPEINRQHRIRFA